MSGIKQKSKNVINRWKSYWKITDIGEISRRYFVMNFFDGVLTVLGLLIGYFIIFLDGEIITQREILVPTISVSVAIGISGVTGGYLAERAERKAEINLLRYSMVKSNIQCKYKQELYYDILLNSNGKDDIDNKELLEDFNLIQFCEEPDEEYIKTIADKAQTFSTNIASAINGIAPFFGGIICVIPFFFSPIPDIFVYALAFLITVITLYLLGYYLAYISEDKAWKYSLPMISAGLITAFFSFLLTS